MTDEFDLKPPILLKPIPKQQVTVGAIFRLSLYDYVQNSVPPSDDDEGLSAGLLYTVDLENGKNLPPDLDYTITGDLYGQLRKEALQHSPYRIKVTVNNGAQQALETDFELEVLPALSPEDENNHDALRDEFADEIALSKDEERELFDALKTEAEKAEGQFTQEKQLVWQALLEGQSIPEIQALMDRPLSHQDIYYLLSRLAYFVIWDAHNPAPAGQLYPMRLDNVDEYFHIYDRGSCIVATPKNLFDHNRTLFHALKVAQAMAHEVFKRGWAVEFGGFDKMVRAAWIEFELLSQKHDKPMSYSYFSPSPHDVDTLNQAKNIRLK